jgi:hypothetical protein
VAIRSFCCWQGTPAVFQDQPGEHQRFPIRPPNDDRENTMPVEALQSFTRAARHCSFSSCLIVQNGHQANKCLSLGALEHISGSVGTWRAHQPPRHLWKENYKIEGIIAILDWSMARIVRNMPRARALRGTSLAVCPLQPGKLMQERRCHCIRDSSPAETFFSSFLSRNFDCGRHDQFSITNGFC